MGKYISEYKKLVKHILDNGVYQKGRNGGMLIVPSYSFTIGNIAKDNKLTLRKMYYKGIDGEFKTLVSDIPLTNVKQLQANGCNYWNTWADDDGSLNLDYYNKLHPSLENIIEQIKKDPNSRRHVISLWDNCNAFNGSLSLPCCWHNLTFSVIENTLHLTWVQRSVDTMVGLPSDVYLAYLFMDYVASKTNLFLGSCMFSLSNVHIYEEHIDNAVELLNRTAADKDNNLKFILKG